MAEDAFNLGNIQEAVASMQQMQTVTSETAAQMQSMNSALQAAASTQASLSQTQMLDPESVQEAIDLVNQLSKSVNDVNSEYAKAMSMRQNQLGIVKDEVSYWKELLNLSNQYQNNQRGTTESEEEGTEEDKKAEKAEKAESLAKKQVDLQEKSIRYVKQQAQAMSGWIQNTAGVQLSLVGILALMLDIYNESRRMGAFQRQYAAQWDYIPKRMKAASGLMGEIRRNFGKTYEEIGPYLNSLAQAGLNMGQMKQLSTELLAVQELQGQAVGDQVSKIQNLVNNFGKTAQEAQGYLSTVRMAATLMREKGGIVISMQEAVELTTELADKTKVYNTDLLGTLSLFNALARKDIAERLGFGDAPLEIRKEIAKTVSGFSAELEDGWKAALGEGTTAASRILEFEKLFPAEQFERMAEFVTEKTAGFTGDTREIAIRNLLKQFGFTSKEVQTVMARAFQTGGLSGEGLKSVMQEISKQREAMSNLEQKAAGQRAKLIEAGQAVSKGLITSQELLARKLRDILRPLASIMKFLIQAIDALIETLRDLFNLKLGGRLGGNVFDLIHGERPAERQVDIEERERRSRREKILEKTVGKSALMRLLPGIKNLPAIEEMIPVIRQITGEGMSGRGISEHAARSRASREYLRTFRSKAEEEELKKVFRLIRRDQIDEAVAIVKDVMKSEVAHRKMVKQVPPTGNYQELGTD